MVQFNKSKTKIIILGISIAIIFSIGLGIIYESDFNPFSASDNEVEYVSSTQIVLTNDETGSTIEGIAHVFKNNSDYQIKLIGHFDSGLISDKYICFRTCDYLIPKNPLTYSESSIVKPSIIKSDTDQNEYPIEVQLFKTDKSPIKDKTGDFMIEYTTSIKDHSEIPSIIIEIISEIDEKTICSLKTDLCSD